MSDPARWPLLGRYRWRWRARLARVRHRGAKIVHVDDALHLLDLERRRFAVTADLEDDDGHTGRFVAVFEAGVEHPALLPMSDLTDGGARVDEHVVLAMRLHAAGHQGDLLSLRRHLDRTLRDRGLPQRAGLRCRLQYLRVTPLPTDPRDLRAEITTWLREELQIDDNP